MAHDHGDSAYLPGPLDELVPGLRRKADKLPALPVHPRVVRPRRPDGTSSIVMLSFAAAHNVRTLHAALKPMVDLPIMAEIAQKMLRDALTAVINRDVAQAERIMEDEKKVDAFRDQIFRTLLTYMMADPGTIQRALSLILICRNIERIGDHATNIAEEAIYIVQGRDVRHAAARAGR